MQSILSNQTYMENKVTKWMDQICDECIQKLISVELSYKFIGKVLILFLELLAYFSKVSCAIMQNNGAGLHSAHGCYWDTAHDFAVQVSWPGSDDDCGRMICIVTAVGMSL